MKLVNLNPPPGRVMIGPASGKNATPTPPPVVDYYYYFDPIAQTIPPGGGASLVFNFHTDDPAPILSDFDSFFSNPTQVASALVYVSGDTWQVTYTCAATPFADNFYRFPSYSNSTGPFGATARGMLIKWQGIGGDIGNPLVPDFPIPWPAYSQLDRSLWVITATGFFDPAIPNSIDGDIFTRLGSFGPYDNNDLVTIDTGGIQLLDLYSILVNLQQWAGDWPVTGKIEWSLDGVAWNLMSNFTRAEVETANNGVYQYNWTNPVPFRYVRLTALTGGGTRTWSFGEIYMFGIPS